MEKVFTHENRLILFNIRNVLQREGIETRVVNEFAGGGMGDLPAFETWPELWVDDKGSCDEARQIVATIMADSESASWYCQGCQEQNGAAFRLCWNCGRSYE